ncbi:MAG: peptidase T [Clostridia bacterium]|nr:peptidase T [Clostridia bacterium]
MNTTERFLKYVSFETTSDDYSETCPSSEKEWDLARYLEKEMKEVGLTDVRLDEYGYVYGYLNATPGYEKADSIGLLAHMDTSNAVSGKDIKPRILKYEGGDIKLNEKVSILASEFPELAKLVGDDLIVTDGTTLLGADDKAGIAEIMAAVEYFVAHPEVPHGRLCIAFTPDEEIGRGTDHFDVENFGADYAYTLDGAALGGIEVECFNAAGASIKINGVSIHPGSAKNKMKNAVLVGNDLLNMLPPAEAPAHTEGYEGFYHVCEFNGSEQEANIVLIIRDHDRAKFEKKKEFLTKVCEFLNVKYGAGTVELTLKDSYRNMIEILKDKQQVVDRAVNAMEKLGVKVEMLPIRGGTDGASLTFKGIPCPNLSTGGGNYHGVLEYLSIQSMNKMVEVIIELATEK